MHLGTGAEFVPPVMYRFSRRGFPQDWYSEEINTIVAFHGKYYHSSPRFNDLKLLHPTCKVPHWQKYAKTLLKDNILRAAGYNVRVIWEWEWDAGIGRVRQIQRKFRSLRS
jgi:hypothetical protein